MDLSEYKRILGASSLGEGFVNDTIDIINANFHNAPSYRKIKVNGVEEDCTIKHTRYSNKLEIYLRPLKPVNKGMYVEIDDNTYIVMDCVQKEVYPKAKITLCNNVLKWKDESDTIYEYKCIIEGSTVELDESVGMFNNRLVISSDSELTVIVPYNEDTRKIDIGQRFIFDESVYSVNSVDRLSEVVNEKGLIKFTIKATGKSDTDDIDKNIADDTGNSGWGGW